MKKGNPPWRVSALSP